MNVKECYASFGGNYEDVLSRLMKDELIVRFALKFLNDDSFDQLNAAMEAKNYDDVFRASHTLKGVSQNLGFTALGESSSELTETLRNRETEPIDEALCAELHKKVVADYEVVAAALKQLDN